SSGLKAPRELVPPSPPFSPIYGRVQKTSVKEAHNGNAVQDWAQPLTISTRYADAYPASTAALSRGPPAALAHRIGAIRRVVLELRQLRDERGCVVQRDSLPDSITSPAQGRKLIQATPLFEDPQ